MRNCISNSKILIVYLIFSFPCPQTTCYERAILISDLARTSEVQRLLKSIGNNHILITRYIVRIVSAANTGQGITFVSDSEKAGR